MMDKKIEEIKAIDLHRWYLETIAHLMPISYNEDAQKSYNELTDEQKSISIYIADKINKKILAEIERLEKENRESQRSLYARTKWVDKAKISIWRYNIIANENLCYGSLRTLNDIVDTTIAEIERLEEESLRYLQDLNDRIVEVERLEKENLELKQHPYRFAHTHMDLKNKCEKLQNENEELKEEISSLHSIIDSIASNSPTEQDVRDAYDRGQDEGRRYLGH